MKNTIWLINAIYDLWLVATNYKNQKRLNAAIAEVKSCYRASNEFWGEVIYSLVATTQEEISFCTVHKIWSF